MSNMQTFTGKEYIKIAAANALGLDQKTWDERLEVGSNFLNLPLEFGQQSAKEPFLFTKAWHANKDAQAGTPTGYIMSLDATASGPQIIACLMGCEQTALNTNLIFNGKRNDAYNVIKEDLNSELNTDFYTRSYVKKPTMATFYGGINPIKEILGENTAAYNAYYKILYKQFPGCMEYMEVASNAWVPWAEGHSFIMPDNHHVYIPTTDVVSKRVQVDELNKSSYTLQREEMCPAAFKIKLVAHITHGIDGYIVRQMLRMAKKQGFRLLHIHDSYWASPNHMNKVRLNYMTILAEIANTDLFGDILTQLSGLKTRVFKTYINLPKDIMESNYTLS